MSKSKTKGNKPSQPAPQIPRSVEASLPGTVIEADIFFEAIPESGAPVICQTVFVGDSDEPVVCHDTSPDGLFQKLIEANTIPGGTARPEHRKFLLLCLSQWKDAVSAAEERVRNLPEWQNPQGQCLDSLDKPLKAKKAKKQNKAKP